MDYKDLTALTLKIAGAILFFHYLTLIPTMISVALKAPVFWTAFFTHFLPSMVNLAFAAVLFLFPATITNKLVKGKDLFQDKTLFVTIEVIAIRLIGIFYLFNATVDLVLHISEVTFTPRYYVLMHATPPATSWTPELIGLTISTVVEIFIALYLTLRAEGISQLVRSLRGRNNV